MIFQEQHYKVERQNRSRIEKKRHDNHCENKERKQKQVPNIKLIILTTPIDYKEPHSPTFKQA